MDTPPLSLPESVAMTMEAIQNIHYIIVCHTCLSRSLIRHSLRRQSIRAGDSGFCFSLHPSPSAIPDKIFKASLFGSILLLPFWPSLPARKFGSRTKHHTNLSVKYNYVKLRDPAQIPRNLTTTS